MNVMICFEVSGKQEQVREELTSKGYMSNWRIARGRDELTYNLPSNAMWKKGATMSPTKAKEDLKNATKDLKVKVIRAVAVGIGKWDGMTGQSRGVEASVSVHDEE